MMIHMLRPKYIFCPIIFVALVLLAISSILASTVTSTEPTSSTNEKLMERGEANDDAGVISATSLVAPLQDGPSILEKQCAHCHLVQRLNQIDKTRSEWGQTLVGMEKFGVYLSDSENDILLYYLTAIDEP
jgi:hypothetical protein